MTGCFADTAVGRDGARARLSRAALERLCAGHFPGDPIVPGAYVAGVMADLGGMVATGRVLSQVERCAFLAPVRPADGLVVVASAPERDAEDLVVGVEVLDGERCLARGRFRFA
jgi:3-hydroxymyristoyl/3-hydroxydecanoyl-(acyl carrier protein) dehydratase